MLQNRPGAALQLDGVGKRYGATVALEPTNLKVESGEFLTLLGPSGSGKTTLLSIVAGLVAPSSGSVRIDGRDVTSLPSHRRNIGMMFQNYALFPHLSVFENIAFPLRMRRWPEREIVRAVGEALEIVQLPLFADRLPGQLSGGQQQRIALARCLVYRPGVILMDEPLGALDRRLRESIQGEIHRLHQELGATIVYVTHDQEEALSLSDRICLMNHARVAQIGTPEELYRRPASVFAAEFLGDSNIFSGTVTAPGVVRHDGIGAQRMATNGYAVGQRLRWMLRPERLIVLPGGCVGEGGRVAATVAAITFGGGVERLALRLADETALQAVRLAGGAPLALGAAVSLSWDAADAVVLEADAT